MDRQIDFNQLYRQPRNNDGHCHGSELDTSYIGVLEDHYYRPYRGTITCCCGLDKRDEDGEWAPAKNFISRCDYRGKENNDANENFERGCGTDMFAFMDKEEFPNKDNTCWTLDNFGKPYKGQEVMDRPPYNQPKARSTFCQDDGSDYEGCTLVLESGSAIRALLMMSTYPLEDARMIDDIKGCDEVHGVRISEKGLELRSYHQLKAVPTDIEGMPVTFSVTYQGCYVDNGQRAFASRAGYLSMEECAMKALESGNSKFAMQWPQGGSDYTAECYMDDKGLLSDSPTATYRKVSDTECKGENWNPTFLSQVFEFNGNGWRNAVYYIEAIGQDGQVTELSFDYKLLGDLPAGEQLHMQVLDTWTCSMSDVITLDLPASSR